MCLLLTQLDKYVAQVHYFVHGKALLWDSETPKGYTWAFN